MKNRGSGCFIFLGLLAILAFVGFFAANALVARAEDAFGPPSPNLNTFQRWRIGIELGLRSDVLLSPADPAAAPVRFEIPQGEPTSQIVSRLWTAGLIREGQLFSNYLFYTGLDTQLLNGSYELSAAMNAVDLAAALLDPTPGTVTVAVLPGWRLEELAASLPAAGVNVPPEDFLLAAWSPPAGVLLPADFPAGATLEGWIRAGSYEVPREAGIVELLNSLLLDFDNIMLSEYSAGLEQQGFSLHQALTIASVVEREAVVEDEMPLIASVFLNRVRAGIKLEADPTVQYAVGYDEARGGWWPTPLTFVDLALDSPYNTYLYAFPPAPIAASTGSAMQSVAYPIDSPYYFFQAACDGSGRHVFSVTYEEHIANNCP